jgi:tRNA threonylcarbamoyladenosine biosynthesis protein TsaE
VLLPTAAATRDLGRRLAGSLRAGDLVILSGELGAGKTTLVQGIGAGLGVRGQVTSPTFVIARTHPAARPGGVALVHVDAYRLDGLDQLDDLDLDTALENAVMVVEWGEGMAEALSPDRLEVHLERATGARADEHRLARLRGVGPRWAAA